MRRLNVNKKSNIKCEHCSYYRILKKLPNRGSIGNCLKNSKTVNYYNKCNKFLWNSKYLSYFTDINTSDTDSKILCKRCGRVLTDSDSIARGFGNLCYKHRLKALEKFHKRLF